MVVVLCCNSVADENQQDNRASLDNSEVHSAGPKPKYSKLSRLSAPLPGSPSTPETGKGSTKKVSREAKTPKSQDNVDEGSSKKAGREIFKPCDKQSCVRVGSGSKPRCFAGATQRWVLSALFCDLIFQLIAHCRCCVKLSQHSLLNKTRVVNGDDADLIDVLKFPAQITEIRPQYIIAGRVLTAVPQSDWRRPVGWPHSSWMATLKKDLSLHNLALEDAIEMALDKPLWGLLAASGATHWWCMPNNDDVMSMS